MAPIKQFTAVLIMCCIGSITFAASLLDMPGQEVSGLSTNPAMVKNWPVTLKQLIGDFGGTVVKTKSPDEIQKLSAKHEPTAYTADMGAVTLFSISRQAVPNAMHAKLLEIFKDLKSENFDEYDHGMTIMATKVGANNYSVTAILLKDKDKSQQSSGLAAGTSIVLNNDITLLLPAGTEILTENKSTDDGVTAEIYNLKLITSGQGSRDFVTSKLSDAGVAYQESSFLNMTTITISDDGLRATLSFEADSAASKNNLATLSISRVN